MSTWIRTMRLQYKRRAANGRIVFVAAIALAVVGLVTGWLLLRLRPLHDAAVQFCNKGPSGYSKRPTQF